MKLISFLQRHRTRGNQAYSGARRHTPILNQDTEVVAELGGHAFVRNEAERQGFVAFVEEVVSYRGELKEGVSGYFLSCGYLDAGGGQFEVIGGCGLRKRRNNKAPWSTKCSDLIPDSNLRATSLEDFQGFGDKRHGHWGWPRS